MSADQNKQSNNDLLIVVWSQPPCFSSFHVWIAPLAQAMEKYVRLSRHNIYTLHSHHKYLKSNEEISNSIKHFSLLTIF